MPTGRKQDPGHLELSALVKMSVDEVLLVDGATGSPLANLISDTL